MVAFPYYDAAAIGALNDQAVVLLKLFVKQVAASSLRVILSHSAKLSAVCWRIRCSLVR